MKNIASALITCAFLYISNPTLAAENTGNLKWCDTVSVIGTLQKSTAVHPFNKSKFPVYTLILAQPLNIAAAECEGSKVDKATTTEIQIKEGQSVLNKSVGKKITVSGLLMFPDNAYDVRPAILYPPISIKTQ